ncbi:MAG: hypothetical protein QM742_04525 [Aquabacterium sp.]
MLPQRPFLVLEQMKASRLYFSSPSRQRTVSRLWDSYVTTTPSSFSVLINEVSNMTSSHPSSSASVVRRTLVVGAVVSAVGLVLSSSLFPHPSQAQQSAPASSSPPIQSNVPQANAPVLVKGPA